MTDLIRRWLKAMFTPRCTIIERYTIRPMTVKERAAFNAALVSMDKAFAELRKVLKHD